MHQIATKTAPSREDAQASHRSTAAAPSWFATPRGGAAVPLPWALRRFLNLFRPVLIGFLLVSYALVVCWFCIFGRRRQARNNVTANEIHSILSQLFTMPLAESFRVTTRALGIYHIRRINLPSPCIELGAQTGSVSSLILGRRIAWGSDIDPMYVEGLESQHHFCKTALVDVLKIPFENNAFGSVLLMNCIYHMDRTKALREIWRVLKPGGLLVLVDAPGYDRIHPIHWLLRNLGFHKLAKRYLLWTFKSHSIVDLKNDSWWRETGEAMGFEVTEPKPFASLPLVRRARTLYEIANAVRLIGGYGSIRRAQKLATQAQSLINILQRTLWEPLLQSDQDLVRKHGALMSLIILRKPGPPLFANPEEEAPPPACPLCRDTLQELDQWLRCPAGHAYPKINRTYVLFPGWENVAIISQQINQTTRTN